MEKFDKIFSHSTINSVQNDQGFRRKIKFLLNLEEDKELPKSSSLAQAIYNILGFDPITEIETREFLEHYDEVAKKVIDSNFENYEADLNELHLKFDLLTANLKKKIHIMYLNYHYNIGDNGPSIYLIFKDDLWCLGKIYFSNTDTTIIKEVEIKPIQEPFNEISDENPITNSSINVFNIIKDQITTFISKIETLKDLTDNFKHQLILSITTSTVSIITSITTLSVENMGKTCKILNCANIACSLTTLAHGIYASIKIYDSNFDLNNALKVIPSAVEMFQDELNTISNASNLLVYIKPAIVAITTIIIGGLTLTGISDAKSIIQSGHLSKAYKEISGDANEVAKFIIQDICQLDMNGDQILHKELIDLALEAGELAITPVYKFCINPELKNSLLTFQTRYQKAAGSKFKDVVNSKTAQSAKSTINSLMSQIIGIIKAVKDVNEQCGRQETVAVMLAGEAGIGKSSLIKPLQKAISEVLGYKNESFDLTKETPDKFYTTYGGQPYGIVNEFMGTSMRNDGFLKSFNKIVSGDHVNLEGSGLEQKYQPADFKVVFLTSNDLCPNLIGDDGLKPNTASAVWSRTLRVLVEDHQFEGRMGKNLHRRKDNSHLSFKIVPLAHQQEINLANISGKLQNISLNSLKDLIIEQVAKREINFLKNMQVPEINGNPVVTNFEDNEIIENRLRTLEALLPKSNAPSKGKEFFTVRMQGDPGVGKTRLASIVSSLISKYRKIPTFNVLDFNLQNDIEGIYIIDDIIYSRLSKIKYLNWINKGHINNLYIICSNTIYKDHKNTVFEKISSCLLGKHLPEYYEIHDHEEIVPTGYYRRIGLGGSVMIEGKNIIQNSARNNINVDFDVNGNAALNNVFLSEETIINEVYIKYLSFLKNCNEIITTDDIAPSNVTSFDVQIISPTVEELCESLSNRYNIRKTVMMGFRKTQFILAKSFVSKVKAFVDDGDWIVPKTATTTIEKEQLFIRMIRSLQKIYDNPIVSVRVAEFNWIYSNGVVYKQNSNPREELIYKNGLVYFKNICITPKMFCSFIKPDIESLHGLTITEIERINYFIENLPEKSKIIYMYQKSLMINGNSFEKDLGKYFLKFKNNKYIWIAAGLCGLITTGATIYALIPKDKKKEERMKSNSADYENHAITKATQRYIQAVRKGNESMKAEIKQEAYDAGFGPAFNQWEHEWRSGYESNSCDYLYDKNMQDKDCISMVKTILQSEDEKAKIDIIREYPHYLARIQSNMLTESEDKYTIRNSLDTFRSSLLKNFVLIKPKMGTFHYGLGIKDKTIITVSHGIDDQQKEVIVSSNGKEYKAKVVALNRRRDMALLEVIEKTFPNFKDITKRFLHNEGIRNISDFWYMRVSPTDSVTASVTAEFVEQTPIPRRDFNNANYQLQDNFFRISFLRADVKKLIRPGDCGMPLIGFKDNEPYIVGIHNSFTGYGLILFGSIDLETIKVLKDNFIANEGKIVQERLINHPTMKRVCVIDEQYKKILKEEPEFSRFSIGDLAPLGVYGYYKQLNMNSNPRHKKLFHPIVGARNVCETMPSCISFIKNKTNPDPLKQDYYGAPHTLFTQAFKYSIRTESYKNKEFEGLSEEIAYTKEMIKFKINTLFGNFRTLNNKEILNGMEYLKPFDITTSCGPALKLKFGLTNKTKLLTNTNKDPSGKPFYIFSEDPSGIYIKQQFDEFKSAIEDGIPIFTVSKNNAKVELLPTNDVKNKSKVRLFNELDFSVNLVLRKYFGYAIDKIMSKCGQTPYCIGANSYTLPTDIMMCFNEITGEHQSSDYAAMDKSVCAELIAFFVEVFCEYAGELAVDALTKTLQYTFHILDGHVYFVNHGNESGSVVTTLLNCFVQDFIDTLTAIRIFKLEMGYFPSFAELMLLYKAFYLGDDGVIKVTYTSMTMEERSKTADMFNMKLTPAKVQSRYVSFCSREFIPDAQSMIYFPALKKSSIISCLYYYEKETYEQIVANINVALFEASFHDEKFFNDIRHDIMLLAGKYDIRNKINYYPYKSFRDHFRNYILWENNSPILLTIGGQESHKINNNKLNKDLIEYHNLVENEQEIVRSNYTEIMENINYCSKLKELCDVTELELPVLAFTKTGADETPIWTATTEYIIQVEKVKYTASGHTKMACKQKISELIYKALKHEQDNCVVKANNGEEPVFDFKYDYDNQTDLHVCQITHKESKRVLQTIHASRRSELKEKIAKMYFDKFPMDYVQACIDEQIKIANAVCVKLNINEVYIFADRDIISKENDIIKLNGTTRYIENGGRIMCLSTTSQAFSLEDVLPYYSKHNIMCQQDGLLYSPYDKSNMEREIAPDAIRGTAVNQQLSTIPIAQSNPQPTGQVMAIAPAGQDAINAIEAIKHQTLNPLGAPNMSTVGAIMFTLPQLCYTQFLDSDKEYVVSDQSPSGTIIFQIPYDPLSEFVNPYVKQWVSLHERYQGALQFRVTVIGNPLFSGYIGVSWQPRKYKGTTMPISEMQKYAYDSKGVTLPWSEVHTLHDARQDLFYRTIYDKDNIDERPHLVVALIASLQNPLKENAIVRIRLASKLSNDPNSFFSSFKPILGGEGPTPPPTNVKIRDIFFDSEDIRIAIDGESVHKQQSPSIIGDQFRRTLMENCTYGDDSFNQKETVFRIVDSALERNDETSFFFEGVPAEFDKMEVGILLSSTYLNFNGDLQTMISGKAQGDEYDMYFKNKRWNEYTLPGHTIYELTPTAFIPRTNGGVKIFTELYIVGKKGKAIISFMGWAYTAQNRSIENAGYLLDAYSQRKAPYGQFTLARVIYSDGALNVPTGFTSIQLAENLENIPDFSVSTLTAPSFTTIPKFRAQIVNFLKNQGITSDVVDSDLYDNQNNILVASIRFTPDFTYVRINSESKFKTFSRNIIDFDLRNIHGAEAGDTLPLTDVSEWKNRLPIALSREDIQSIISKIREEVTLNIETTSNAGIIAAGALQGIGQGISQFENFQFEKFLQNNAFEQRKQMQQQYFDGQLRLRGASTQAELYQQQSSRNQPTDYNVNRMTGELARSNDNSNNIPGEGQQNSEQQPATWADIAKQQEVRNMQ